MLPNPLRYALYISVLTIPATPVWSSVTIEITQTTTGVDVTVNGTINLTDLTQVPNASGPPGINPSAGFLGVGPLPGYQDQVYTGISGPGSFGPGNLTQPSSATGGILDIGDLTPRLSLGVADGYVSGTQINATNNYDGQTISGLGLTPGQYTWTWGTGSDADSLTLQIGTPTAVPEPSTAIVAVFGAVAFLAYGWSRHRRDQRRLAAA